MLTNFHTHTVFCDGKSTAEEVVLSAIDKGFVSLGFSGHGYTSFDTRYCIKDNAGYIAEIKRLKEKYKNKIQIYLGIEEDAFSLTDRTEYEYIIGSCHYFNINGKYCPIDLSYEELIESLNMLGGDAIALAKNYYEAFCGYIKQRKPDIVGHFDLITKFDELDSGAVFLENKDYLKLSEEYLKYAMQNDVIFEVNTGAISRGYRKTPYPAENLLHLMKKENAKIILSSDSHSADTIDCYFEETRKLLLDVGFEWVYTLYDGEFKKIHI